MYLRKLKMKDIPLMLEWMHDKSVTHDLQTDFSRKTMLDARRFIQSSWDDKSNINLAIASDLDEYMGTVSLKHIENGSAEFAIVVRASAMGQGYSKYGMEEILRIGFEEKGLKTVYWCVAPHNSRAIRFYEKNGYRKTSSDLILIGGGYSKEQIQNYYWYLVQSK